VGLDCSAGFVPPAPSGFEFSILPDRSFILGRKSLPVCGQTCGIHDIGIVLATTVIADLEVLHDFKQLMIKKASIHSYDNRYIGTILFSDFLNDINQHAIGGITMIGVLLAAPEYGVNKVSAPIQLQGLETSGNSSALLRHRPLRTQHATFTALGSSLD